MHSNLTQSQQTQKPANKHQGLTYALPVLATSFLGSAIAVLQGVYAKDFGMALTSIAMVLMVSRVFDAITDPLIGYCSDWYKTRGGSRKPFMAVGGMLFAVSGYFLYVPPENVSVSYFLSWYLVFYFGLTLFDIPHLAWANDLASSAREKNAFYSWRALMMSIGLMSFFILPLLPIFETSAITPETLRWSALVAGGLLTILLTICIRRLPSISKGSTAALDNQPAQIVQRESASKLWRSIRSNPPLLLFISGFICFGFGIGMSMTLLFLFIDSYLDFGYAFALLYVISHIFSISSVGLWAVLANRWGKKTVWGIAMSLFIIALLGAGFLSPTNVNHIALLLCLTPFYCAYAAVMIIAPSLLSDVIDYSTWKFKRDRGATFFSLFTLITKTNGAIGGAVGLALAGLYGFDASATVHSVESAFGLRLGLAWIPIPFLLLSFFIIVRMPINMRRHAIVRRALDRRLNRASKQPHNSNQHLTLPNHQANAVHST